MFKHRKLQLAGAILASLAFAGTALAANSTVVVTPTNTQGWTVTHAPAPPVDFNGPADSDGGNGSLHFGPITAPNAMKLELQPPEINRLVSDFGGFEFEYQILAPVAGNSANHFYANVYVDSSVNGIGVFTNGFYDCRYSYVATNNAAGWNSLMFNASTAPTAAFGGLCTPTLGAQPAASEIRFFRLNAGDTSGSDNGLEGAFDLVSITFGGDTVTYDFEPFAVVASKNECKDGGWQNVNRADGSSFKNQGDCIQYANTGK